MKETGRIVMLAFAPEWCLLLCLAAVDAVWARFAGLHLGASWRDAVPFLAIGGMIVLMRLPRLPLYSPRVAGIAEYTGLSLAAGPPFMVLSYLAFAQSWPLADQPFLAADRALGFDWMAGYQFLAAHPIAGNVLRYAYDSPFFQGLCFIVLMGVTGRTGRMRELFWLISVAGLFTSLCAMFVPAFGPFQIFGVDKNHDFLIAMRQLKAGKDLSFMLSGLTGVVSFPSLHTTLALAYAYGFRKMGAVSAVAAVINVLMLCSVPYFGGHYLVDMIGGAVVFVLSLGCISLWRARRMVPAELTPEPLAEAG